MELSFFFFAHAARACAIRHEFLYAVQVPRAVLMGTEGEFVVAGAGVCSDAQYLVKQEWVCYLSYEMFGGFRRIRLSMSCFCIPLKRDKRRVGVE